MSNENPIQLVDERRAGEMLGLSIRTLQDWRCRGGGPRYLKISAKCVRYDIADILEWAQASKVRHTSEPAAVRLIDVNTGKGSLNPHNGAFGESNGINQ
jgi:predicted DNA-binding transcriptional regulator AlpA